MMDYVEPGVYYYTVLFQCFKEEGKFKKKKVKDGRVCFYDRFTVKIEEQKEETKSAIESHREAKKEEVEIHKINLEFNDKIDKADKAATEKRRKENEEWYKISIQAIDLDPDTTEEEKRKKKETLELDYYAKMDRLKK